MVFDLKCCLHRELANGRSAKLVLKVLSKLFCDAAAASRCRI